MPRALATLRGRLTLAATAGLLVTMAMTAVLVGTARSAGAVVDAAQASHDRTQTFSRLQSDTDRFQQAAFAAVRLPSREAAATLREGRAAFLRSLHRAVRLPRRGPADAAAATLVARQGQAALQLLDHADRLVAKVDARWRTEGSLGALDEVQRVTKPYLDLIETSKREIARGDDDIRSAAARAASIQRAALPTAVTGIICSLLFSGVTLMLVLSRLVPGLRRLEAGARSIGDGAARPIGLRGRDELARLAEAFDTMSAEIARQRQELRGTAETLEEAVRERTRELEQTHAALAAEDHRRRIFFAEVSHELRTPITIISGEAQVALRNAYAQTGDPAESFARILEQSKDLGRLVRDLFLIARAEADGLELQLERMAAAPLLEQMAQDFEPSTAELGATILVDADANLFLHADRTRLRQMLGALIDNALVHTRPGVTITLIARAEGDEALLAVEDDGPGVETGAVDQLLQRFRRGSSRAEGAGLGLTIVRALAEAQGGRVQIVNGRRCGLRVEIRMPARPDRGEEQGDVGSAAGRGRRARQSVPEARA